MSVPLVGGARSEAVDACFLIRTSLQCTCYSRAYVHNIQIIIMSISFGGIGRINFQQNVGALHLLRTWDPYAKPQISCIVPLHPPAAQLSLLQIKTRAFGIHHRQTKGLDMEEIPCVKAALPKLKTFLGLPMRQGLTILSCTPDSLSRTDRNLAPLSYIGSPAVRGYAD